MPRGCPKQHKEMKCQKCEEKEQRKIAKQKRERNTETDEGELSRKAERSTKRERVMLGGGRGEEEWEEQNTDAILDTGSDDTQKYRRKKVNDTI